MATATQDRLDIGQTIGDTIGLIRRNAKSAIPLTLVFSIAPLAATGWFNLTDTGRVAGVRASDFTSIIPALIGSCVTSVLNVFLSATLMAMAQGDIEQGRADWKASLVVAARGFPGVLVLAIYTGVATLLCYLLLIVPGILVGLHWIVARPAKIIEGVPITAAMSRSGELTRGQKPALFAIACVFYGVSLAVWGIGWMSNRYMPLSIPLYAVSTILKATYQGVSEMVGAFGCVAIYYRLRDLKGEGIASKIGSVFG